VSHCNAAERYGKSLAIRSTDADGPAPGSADSWPIALRAADSVRDHRLPRTSRRRATCCTSLFQTPAILRSISELIESSSSAFSVTSSFETSGDRFQQITGNFDGAGLSFGPAQWNFKSGTLVPLFRAFEQRDAGALRQCFSDPIDYEEWDRLLGRPVSEQIAWANDISTGRGKQEVAEPWRGYFQAVGRVRPFRAIMVEQALRTYGARCSSRQIPAGTRARDPDRSPALCVCSLYDLVINRAGSTRPTARSKRGSGASVRAISSISSASPWRNADARRRPSGGPTASAGVWAFSTACRRLSTGTSGRT
jgi:hypothetical protein